MNLNVEYDPRVFTKKILSMLESANERIVISALYIQNDEFGNKLLNLLSQIATEKPSIVMDVFLDGIYNVDWLRNKFANLTKNIHIIKLNKFLPLRVFHVKGWIIDNTLIYSGVNVNNRYFPEHDSFRLDRYYFMQNKELCDLHYHALHQIKYLSESKRWSAICTNNFNYNNSDFSITPFYLFSKNRTQEDLIFDLCCSAKKEIFLSTPYFNISEKLKELLKCFVKDGGVIRIVVGINNYNKKNYNDRLKSNNIIASFYFDILFFFMREFESELNKSVFIYQWKNKSNSYHVKNLLIDDEISLLTSSNFNYRSDFLDYENGFIIKAKSDKIKTQFLEEKNRILRDADCSISMQDINSYVPSKHKKIISFLKRINLYKLVSRVL